MVKTESQDQMTLKDLILIFKEILSFLLGRWILISGFIIIGGIAGYLYGTNSKPTYTAITTFVLEEGGGGGALGEYSGLAAMAGIDLGGTKNGLFSGENIIELYKSRNMLEKTLLKSGEFQGKNQILIDRYLEFNKTREKWTGDLKNISFNDPPKFTITHDSIIGKIVESINLANLNVSKPNKKLSILKVEFKSRDELFAKRFNEELVSTVNQFYVDTKTKKSLENVQILQWQTDSVRRSMNNSITASASAIDATPNLNQTRQVLRSPAQRSQFNAEANKVILSELIKNLELAKLNLRKETPLIQVIDSPVLPLKREQLSKLKGTVVGAFLAGLLITGFLLARKYGLQYLRT